MTTQTRGLTWDYVCEIEKERDDLRAVLESMTDFYSDMRLNHVMDYGSDDRRRTMALIKLARELVKS